jgi:prepilin-type N-terminal cleavage/methylation domain-containing protein
VRFCNPRHNRTGGRGFTLIELLVVMMIIAIAFFALRPNFVRSIQGNRDRAALRRVVGVLTSARTEAVARGRLVRVVVVPGQGEMWGEIQSDPEEDKSQFDLLPLMNRARTALPDYIALADLTIGGESPGRQNEGRIYFYPDGRTSGAGLTVLGAAGGEYPVDLSPTTGRVRIAE